MFCRQNEASVAANHTTYHHCMRASIHIHNVQTFRPRSLRQVVASDPDVFRALTLLSLLTLKLCLNTHDPGVFRALDTLSVQVFPYSINISSDDSRNQSEVFKMACLDELLVSKIVL